MEESPQTALAAYWSLDPHDLPGETPLEQIEEWIAACEDQPLSAEQTLQFAWLQAERGLCLATLANVHNASRSKHSNKSEGIVQYESAGPPLQAANKLFGEVLSDAEATPMHRAQSLLALGSLPLWRARKLNARELSTQVLPLAKQYQQRQAQAAMEAGELLKRSALTPEELVFCQSLGAMIAINSLGSQVFALAAPPRCYKIEAMDEWGWQSLLYDFRLNREINLRVSTGKQLPGGITLLPRPERPEEPDDPDRLLLLRACVASIAGKELSDPEQKVLRTAAGELSKTIGRLIVKKVRLTMQLPTLAPVEAAATAEESSPVTIDLEPVSMPRLSLEGVTPATLIDWYNSQTSGSSLTSREGLTLHELSLDYRYENYRTASLSAAELLARERIEMECAKAAWLCDLELAKHCIEEAAFCLDKTQKLFLERGDTTALLEAALEQRRAKVYELILSGKSITPEDVATHASELAAIVSEMDWERNNNKSNKELRARFKHLTPIVLNAALLTKYLPGVLAMPSLPREQGTDQAPGWDINVWRLDADGKTTLDNMCKVRLLSDESPHLLRQGDVAIVPLNLIRQGQQSGLMLKNLIAAESDEDARAKKLLASWQPEIAAVFSAALELVAGN